MVPVLCGSPACRISRRRGCEGLCQKFVRAFLNFDAVVHRQFFEGLRETTGPANAWHATVPSTSSQSEEKLLGVLRQKSGTSLQIFGLAMVSCFDRDRGADRIAIALCVRADGMRSSAPMSFMALCRMRNLRRVAVLENDFQPAVVIEVGQRK